MRSRLAGVPAGTPFASRPDLIRLMVERALHAQVPARWVAADDAYGDSRALRSWLDERDVPYVLATTREDRVATAAGHVAEVHDLAAVLPRSAWERRSTAGRIQEWARVPLAGYGTMNGHRFERCLLMRRTPGEREHLTYYRCRLPAGTPLAELIRVARAPMAADECLTRARRALGLGQYQVRRYDAWYRHVTLCMVAGAHLAAWSAAESAGAAAALSPPPNRYRTVSIRGRAV
jgi:SRSO17 transposase